MGRFRLSNDARGDLRMIMVLTPARLGLASSIVVALAATPSHLHAQDTPSEQPDDPSTQPGTTEQKKVFIESPSNGVPVTQQPTTQPTQVHVHVTQPTTPYPGRSPYPANPPVQRRPRRVPYDGGPIPPGAIVQKKRRLGLLIPGAVMFAVPYFIGVFTYSLVEDLGGDISASLLIPGIGPFITIKDAETSSGRSLLALDGLLQVAGLTMFVAGLVPRKYLLYTRNRRNRHVASAREVRSVAWLPWAGRGAAGLTVSMVR